MKKNGFTLAEILVAVGIVGVVAALSAPMISNFAPDKDKIAVLKLNKLIVDTTADVLGSTEWFINSPVNCYGLLCLTPPAGMAAQHGITDAQLKANPYAYLLSEKMAVKEEKWSDYTRKNESVSFNTTDGNTWKVTSEGSGYYSVNVDLHIPGRESSTYLNSDLYKTLPMALQPKGCKKPSQFQFMVKPSGKVVGYDPLTTAYLATPDKLSNKKEDYAVAAEDKTKYYQPYKSSQSATAENSGAYKDAQESRYEGTTYEFQKE